MQPERKNKAPDKTHKLATDKTVKLAQELVRVPSITAVNAEDKPASHKSIEVMIEAAKKTGARIETSEFSGGHPKWDYAVENLYLEWTFGDG
ncbi:MAG TPA: hypothetical protein VHP34_10460, partial [Alphaproteobacteria bacterium]|nr:hypothetical protein [Alphaproteobacteria bacterium]